MLSAFKLTEMFTKPFITITISGTEITYRFRRGNDAVGFMMNDVESDDS